MRFRILGPLEVWDGGKPVSVGGPQQRALLAVLLLNANQVVSADRLMGELWNGEPPPSARRLLQGCVVRLRRALAEDRQPLVTRAPGYLLEVRPGELDVDRFDELVTAAEPLLGKAGALEEAAALLTNALALWRGPSGDGRQRGGAEREVRQPVRQLGAPALIIREVVRRTGRGWPSIVPLATACGLVQAGLVHPSPSSSRSFPDGRRHPGWARWGLR